MEKNENTPNDSSLSSPGTLSPAPTEQRPDPVTTTTTPTPVASPDATPVATQVPTPEPTAHLPRRIQILSWYSGGYPMVTIYGLASLTSTFFPVLKQRLSCPGKCGSHRIELWNAKPEDVARVLVGCDYPEAWIQIRRL